MSDRMMALPLAVEQQPAATWESWSLAEPLEPQGAYSQEPPGAMEELPRLGGVRAVAKAELLAPAGGPEAGYAAFHFGADAIYLGLQKFSARAEAENFTLQEVDEITAYAHSLTPLTLPSPQRGEGKLDRRRVFVTVNTVVRQDELPELVEALATLDEIGVDAIILQDLGVYHLLRKHFPRLELHASTQLAVHNRAGAEMLHDLGFSRVVLARELTFEEVHDITEAAGIETEVFIHGALCYSYSGLCLFSAQTLGRSGNRGKCAYSCRDAFDVSGAPLELRDGTAVKRDPREGFPFSMKDLALPDHMPALQAAGVSCFKIEGRKKSPLYVATTTDYYRKLLDGQMPAADRPEHEADMQTVFSRPWTRLFVESHQDKEVADRDTVGHRGTLIGRVESVTHGPEPRLRFRTTRALQRHDGLQVDLPTLGKPYGFAVERLWIIEPGRKGRLRDVFEADAGVTVEVSLPRDHPPLPAGAPVYCSSSQSVKQEYRFDRPKPGLHRIRHAVDVDLVLTSTELVAIGRIAGDPAIERQCKLAGPFQPAKEPGAMVTAAKETFEKLGQTRLELNRFHFANDSGLFVPVSRQNQLRRELTTALEDALRQRLAGRIQRIQAETCHILQAAEIHSGSRTEFIPFTTQNGMNSVLQRVEPRSAATADAPSRFHWSLMVDQIGFLDSFDDADFADIDEVVIDIARDHPSLLMEKLNGLSDRIGRDHVRLALPALTRSWEDAGLRHKIARLTAAGWTKWQAANLSAWKYLPDPKKADLSTDWSIYVVNCLAAKELLGWGVSRFTLSPEDGFANVRSLLAEFGERATLIVYQDTPLFLAESCAYANLIGGCPGKANCKFESMEMVSTHGERVTALDYHCRTIVLNQGPFCLSTRLPDLAKVGAVSLRADFIYRKYHPDEVRERWRLTALAAPCLGDMQRILTEGYNRFVVRRFIGAA